MSSNMTEIQEIKEANVFAYINEIKQILSSVRQNLKDLADKLYEVKVNRLYKQMGADVSWGEFCEEVGISPTYAFKLIVIAKNNLSERLQSTDVEKLYTIASAPLPPERKKELAYEANMITRNDLKQNILEERRGEVCYHEEQEVFIRIKCVKCGYETKAVVRTPNLINAIKEVIKLEMENENG